MPAAPGTGASPDVYGLHGLGRCPGTHGIKKDSSTLGGTGGQGDSPSGYIKEATHMGAQQGATYGPGHNSLNHGKVNAYLHRANPAEALAAGAETFRSSMLSIARPMVDGVGGHRWLMLSIITRPVVGGIDCQPSDG